MKSKLLLKSVSAIFATAVFVGTTLAGPSNPTAPIVAGNRIVSAGCPMQSPVTKTLGITNPKSNTQTKVVVGARFEGCTGTTVANMTCKGSSLSCSEMLRS